MERNFTKPINSLIPQIKSLDSAKTEPSAPPNLSSASTLQKSELSKSEKYLSGANITDLEYNPSDFTDLDPISNVSPLRSEPCQEIENHKAAEVEVELPLSLSVGAQSSKRVSVSAESRVVASVTAMQSTSRPRIVGAGLINLGNTCFLNAVMQCFTHTVPLIYEVNACRHKLHCNATRAQRFCVVCALIDHVNFSMYSPEFFAPQVFVDNLKYFSTNFDRGQQEDAHEFLQCFLDKLEQCWNVSNQNDVHLQGTNIVQQVFGGRIVSNLRCCNCGYSSDTYEPLIDVSLEIENANTLSGALDSFTKVEKIEDPQTRFTCRSCNEQVFIEKQLMLDQAPTVAAFQLKRFKIYDSYVEKIDKFVSFPLELDLRPYTGGRQTQRDELKYELYAVVVHVGCSSNSGHYYCFVRSAPNVWYKLDDDQVIWVTQDSVLSQEAYILFYAQKKTPSFSRFVEIHKLAMTVSNRNTSPTSVLDDTSSLPLGSQSNGPKPCAIAYEGSTSTLATEKTKESRNNECGNKENFMPVSTPCVVTSSSPVALPLNDSDSILKENNSSRVPEVMNLGNVTPPPMSTRSPILEIYKEGSDQHFSIPRGHAKSADQVSFKRLQLSIPDGHSKSADQVSCKRQYFSIPDGHLNSAEDQVSCKRQLNRELESVELKQACALIKKRMPGSRGQQLMAALGGSLSEGSVNKKRSRTIHQLPDAEDKNSRQKGTGQSNAAASFS